MKNGGLSVTARCAACHEKGANNFRVWDGNGNVFWSSKTEYAEIAKLQRGSDGIILADALSHIPWVVSCGCSAN